VVRGSLSRIRCNVSGAARLWETITHTQILFLAASNAITTQSPFPFFCFLASLEV
jgi:hypothetical protein